MNFTVVEEVPGVRKAKKKLRNIFNEFMNMNVKVAKYEFNENEYKNVKSAYGNLHAAARKHGYPIHIHIRHGEIYFERRDI